MNALSLILIAGFISGSMSALTKIALTGTSPVLFTVLRFSLAALTLVPIFYFSKEKITFAGLKNAVLVSLLAAANVFLYIFGLSRTTASIAPMLYGATPLIAGIFSYFLLRERLEKQKLLGITIGFIGVVVIILLPLFESGNKFSGDLIGHLLVFGAVISFSLYTVLSKKLMKHHTPLSLTLIFFLVTLILGSVTLPMQFTSSASTAFSPAVLVSIAFVGIIGTGIYYLLYQKAIHKATPVLASMILYLQPIFSIVWAALLLSEKITAGFIIGSILTFIGIALTTRSKSAVIPAPEV